MARTPIFDALTRAIRIARFCEEKGIPTDEGVELAREIDARAQARRWSRREFLAGAGTVAAVAACAVPSERRRVDLAAINPNVDVAIVGAGLAGLACGRALLDKGVASTIYDAGSRVGGRCYSMGPLFPGPVTWPGGQTIERGGELIDTGHKTLLGWANEFGLALESMEKQPGEVFYYFGGQHHPEAAVVEEYRAFVAAMRDDLRTLDGDPSADNATPNNVALDNVNLLEYLETRGAGSLVKAVIIEAYEAEYGLNAEAQSCLNFLLFIHADKRSKFRPFGVFSDERYHIVSGNQQIPARLAAILGSQIELGQRLVRVRKNTRGRIELTFKRSGGPSVIRDFDFVVLAIPFTVLRGVELDASLALPTWKTKAINELGYGTNAKMMVGFSSRPWTSPPPPLRPSNGASYSDLSNHQATWETNPTLATATNAVLTDYRSGTRGARPRSDLDKFLADLDLVFPGAKAAFNGRSHLEHWPSNPLTLGSYTCYLPGQFTSIAGNEGKRVGNLLFAGEHADSFYAWQGFMEGAALSGLAAAKAILDDLKK
jgi:monoamine oxidase